jgi:peptidoglycan/xylan/chitin deacetylase (PgdA/CDA1 family)
LRFGPIHGLAFGFVAIGVAAAGTPGVVSRLTPQSTEGVVFSAPVAAPVIALSIDDGPSAATASILDVLRENDARASFFVIGEHLLARRGAADRILDDGHELAHHMMRDEPSIRLPADRFTADFERMAALLEEVGGSRLFRPGSGWFNRAMVRTAADRGYRTVLGSVYPFDALIPFPAFLSWYILRGVRPGAILVLHDGPERGPRTVEVLRRVLPELGRRGYRVVTVTELLGLPPAAGPDGITAITAPH